MKPIAMTEWGTFRWIGDGGRPTDVVVEHVLRLRWPGRSDQTGLTAGPSKWQLYTLDRQPSTIWPLAAIWPRQEHVSADFLTTWSVSTTPAKIHAPNLFSLRKQPETKCVNLTALRLF